MGDAAADEGPDPRLGWFERRINAGVTPELLCARAVLAAGACGRAEIVSCSHSPTHVDTGIKVKSDKVDKFMKGDPMGLFCTPPFPNVSCCYACAGATIPARFGADSLICVLCLFPLSTAT